MARTKSRTIKEEPKKLICYCCGKEKKEIDFYASKSFTYQSVGRLPMCKECLGKIYDKYYLQYNDIKLALYYMCRTANICFNLSCYNATLNESEKKTKTLPWKIYMTKLNSLGSSANGAGTDFDESDNIDVNKEIQENLSSNSYNEETVEFWGEGYTTQDYKFLNNEYEKMITRYECDSYAQETLFQDIAFQRLEIRKKRQTGQSVDKELKTLQDLLGSANIKPAQENASMASEQLTFGTLIKKFENEEPIPEPLDEWKKNNWIHYVLVWFLGNLCNMMGKKNPYEEEWKEEMNKYTVTPNYGDEDE